MNRSWPRAGVFLLGIMVMATIRSQDLSTDLVESVLQESGSIWSEELLQILQDELPFDLNDSLARDRMLDVGVFDAAQHRALEDHIRRYGPLLNVYELGVMDAFSVLWIAQWLSWVHCGSSRKAGAGRWKGRVEQSLRFRSMLSESEAGGGGVRPQG
ncbi:MAG: hypothetical protein IH599_04690 [Bacteroidales bacterium]|nr:hypothetical protein [Bacteroidales bacterium]